MQTTHSSPQLLQTTFEIPELFQILEASNWSRQRQRWGLRGRVSTASPTLLTLAVCSPSPHHTWQAGSTPASSHKHSLEGAKTLSPNVFLRQTSLRGRSDSAAQGQTPPSLLLDYLLHDNIQWKKNHPLGHFLARCVWAKNSHRLLSLRTQSSLSLPAWAYMQRSDNRSFILGTEIPALFSQTNTTSKR